MGSKYKNVKTVVDGIKFDSKKEAERYKILCRMEECGTIEHLELQRKILLLEPQTFPDPSYNERAVYYKADFFYWDKIRKRYVVEDVKGSRKALRPEYIIKRKLFKVRYPETLFVEVY